MSISISFRKQPNLPFKRPNVHSLTIRADESLNPNNCSFLLDPPFTNPSLKKATMGTQGLLKYMQVLDLPLQL